MFKILETDYLKNKTTPKLIKLYDMIKDAKHPYTQNTRAELVSILKARYADSPNLFKLDFLNAKFNTSDIFRVNPKLISVYCTSVKYRKVAPYRITEYDKIEPVEVFHDVVNLRELRSEMFRFSLMVGQCIKCKRVYFSERVEG